MASVNVHWKKAIHGLINLGFTNKTVRVCDEANEHLEQLIKFLKELDQERRDMVEELETVNIKAESLKNSAQPLIDKHEEENKTVVRRSVTMNNTDIMRKVNEINQQNLGKGQGGKKDRLSLGLECENLKNTLFLKRQAYSKLNKDVSDIMNKRIMVKIKVQELATEYEKSIVQRFQNKIKIKLLRKKVIDRHKQLALEKTIFKQELGILCKELEDHKEVNDTTREKLEDIYLNCCSGDERNKTLKEENDLIKQQLRVRKLSMLDTEEKIEYFKTAIEKEKIALTRGEKDYDRLCFELKNAISDQKKKNAEIDSLLIEEIQGNRIRLDSLKKKRHYTGVITDKVSALKRELKLKTQKMYNLNEKIRDLEREEEMLEKNHIGFLKRHKVQTDQLAKVHENWNNIIQKRQEELDWEKTARTTVKEEQENLVYVLANFDENAYQKLAQSIEKIEDTKHTVKETNSVLKSLLEEIKNMQDELAGLEEVVPKKEEKLSQDKEEINKNISKLELSIVDEKETKIVLKEKIDMLEPTYLELKQSYTSVKAEKRKSFVDLKCKDEKLFEKKMHKKKYKNRLKETDSLIESLKRELLFVNKDVLNNDIKHREELLLSGDALRSLIKMDHSLVAENTNIVVGANSCISNLEDDFHKLLYYIREVTAKPQQICTLQLTFNRLIEFTESLEVQTQNEMRKSINKIDNFKDNVEASANKVGNTVNRLNAYIDKFENEHNEQINNFVKDLATSKPKDIKSLGSRVLLQSDSDLSQSSSKSWSRIVRKPLPKIPSRNSRNLE